MMDLRPDLSSWSRGSYLPMWLMEKAIKAGGPYAENTAWCPAKLAVMLFQDGAYEPAAQILAPVSASGTTNTHVLLAAGRIAAARGDFPAAIEFYQKILTVGPNHEALAGLGDIYAAQGEKEKAEEYYKKVEALHAAHLATGVHDHMLMAKFYADHDRNLIEALRLAEQRKLTKNVLEADVLAWVYFKNGDLPQAQEAMQRALRQQTPDAETHYHAGMIAAAAGERGKAQKELGRALSINPKFSLLQSPLAAKALEEIGGRATSTATAHVATGP
ncbi:MAG: tetratricopeptide repeat protein [Verrucomicrobiota bacterium]|nr:tetratricopeptide repeat protein [Verrucomicrobiota bacterium]